MAVMHLATSVHCVGRYLIDGGALPCEVLRDIDLPPDLLFDSRAWIPRDAVFGLGETLKQRMSDPLAVIHVVERFLLSEYGEWSARLCDKTDLHEALRHLCLNIGLLETGTRLSLHMDGKACRLRAELKGKFEHSPDSYTEGLLLNLLRVIRLAGDAFSIRVCLPHAAHDVTALEQIYNSRVSFSCNHAELSFARDALQLPLAQSPFNPELASEGPEFTCREVNRVIHSTLDYDCPTARQVANDLSVNLRSMQRHLAAWGITFEEMLDIYRQRRALQYLTDQTDSITDIAQHLGYSDAAHFTRAFRRWYGVPPAAFRKEQCQLA